MNKRLSIAAVIIGVLILMIPYLWRTEASLFTFASLIAAFVWFVTAFFACAMGAIRWRILLFALMHAGCLVTAFILEDTVRLTMFRLAYAKRVANLESIVETFPKGDFPERDLTSVQRHKLRAYRATAWRKDGRLQIDLHTIYGPSLETISIRPREESHPDWHLAAEDDWGKWYLVPFK